MSPSTLAVSMSAPLPSSCFTSSLSPAAQAAKNTQPSLNPIRLFFDRGSPASRKVSLSCHRFSCSARLISAELERVSRDMATINSPPSPLSASQCTVLLGAGQSCRLALRLLANSCYFLRRAASEPRGRSGRVALRQLAAWVGGGVDRQQCAGGRGTGAPHTTLHHPLSTPPGAWLGHHSQVLEDDPLYVGKRYYAFSCCCRLDCRSLMLSDIFVTGLSYYIRFTLDASKNGHRTRLFKSIFRQIMFTIHFSIFTNGQICIRRWPN